MHDYDGDPHIEPDRSRIPIDDWQPPLILRTPHDEISGPYDPMTSHDPDMPAKPQALGIFAGDGSRYPGRAHALFHVIPQELRVDRAWCVWSYQYDVAGCRWRKPPYIPSNGGKARKYRASAKKPQYWVSITRANHAMCSDEEQQYDGVGRFFSAEDPFVVIDLDYCFDEAGRLSIWAADVLAIFPGAYVEYSPSGCGLKLWTRGGLPGPGRKVGRLGPYGTGAVEIYDRDRYFTVTGVPYGEPIRVITDGSAAVLTLYERLDGRGPDSPARGAGGRSPVRPAGDVAVGIGSPGSGVLPDDVVIAKARRTYPEFGALFDSGELSLYGNDWSRGDAALIKLIAFYACKDREQILRVFGRSALANREKWANRPDYREATISAGLAGMTGHYDPKYRSGPPAAVRGSSQLGGGA